MMRKIYLEGELGTKFVTEFDADVASYQDTVKLLNANFPDFKQYLIECHEKGVGFAFETEGAELEKEQDLILPLREGDITITPIPAGAKSGGSKIVAAILILIAIFMIPVDGAASLSAAVKAGTSAGLQATFYAAFSVAVNLAITGIQQIMAPDPGTDSDAPQAYLFNGSQQNVIEGDPVPILYGELRVPGTPIGFGVINGSNEFNSEINQIADPSGITTTSGRGRFR